MSGAKVYIGLGSNLSDPITQLTRAVRAIKSIPSSHSFQISSVYQSKAIGPEQPDYLNACASFITQLDPLEVLDALQRIENVQGRTRTLHWGPRTLDLDLLLYDQTTLISPRLTLPHPYLHLRNFVVVPLFELNPDLVLPCGTRLQDLRISLGDTDLTVLPTLVN
jgi:2-amino-4-hydroxy-6-hydroxymethyldihydropteridine diphosphokinase